MRYLFHEYLCYQCGADFAQTKDIGQEARLVPGLLAYIIYQIIELHVLTRGVTQNLNQLFAVNLRHTTVKPPKIKSDFVLQRHL